MFKEDLDKQNIETIRKPEQEQQEVDGLVFSLFKDLGGYYVLGFKNTYDSNWYSRKEVGIGSPILDLHTEDKQFADGLFKNIIESADRLAQLEKPNVSDILNSETDEGRRSQAISLLNKRLGRLYRMASGKIDYFLNQE